MCMFCDWDGPMLGEVDDTPETAEAAEERRRAAQEGWARLMEQLARPSNKENSETGK